MGHHPDLVAAAAGQVSCNLELAQLTHNTQGIDEGDGVTAEKDIQNSMLA